MQKRFNTEILDSFLNNRECLQAFLDSTGVESLKDLVAYDAYLFESDEIANRSQASRNEYVNGFVISAQNKKIYIISPSNDYIRFWGRRNFFTWRLAKNHQNKNDGIERHVINIHNQDSKNHTEAFNTIKDFYVHNIYASNLSNDLNDWINVLFLSYE